MLLPNKFKDEVATRFYDKTINIIESSVVTEPDGGTRRDVESIKASFQGNVRFNTLGTIQNELGLTIDADIIITCDTATEANIGEIISYLEQKYIITDSLPCDSHRTITAKKCQ